MELKQNKQIFKINALILLPILILIILIIPLLVKADLPGTYINITGANCTTQCNIYTPYYNATIKQGVVYGFYGRNIDNSTVIWSQDGSVLNKSLGGLYNSTNYLMESDNSTGSILKDTVCTMVNTTLNISMNCYNYNGNKNNWNNWTFTKTFIKLRTFSSGAYRSTDYFEFRANSTVDYNESTRLFGSAFITGGSNGGMVGYAYNDTRSNYSLNIIWDQTKSIVYGYGATDAGNTHSIQTFRTVESSMNGKAVDKYYKILPINESTTGLSIYTDTLKSFKNNVNVGDTYLAPTAPTSATMSNITIHKWDSVSCTATGATSPEGLSITYYYKFVNSTSTLQDWSTNNTYDCKTKSNCIRNSEIYCQAMVIQSDGQNSSTKNSGYTGIIGLGLYVSNRGFENNTGVMPNRPLKTMTSMFSRTKLVANESYMFESNSTFRQLEDRYIYTSTSGNATGFIKYTSYGEGSKAKILMGINKTTTGNWTSMGSNKWYSTDVSTANLDVGHIVFNHGSTYGNEVYAQSSLTSQGKWFYNSTNDIIMMYSTSNPATYYNNIELGLKYNLVVLNNVHHIWIDNLDFRHGSLHGIAVSTSAYTYDIRITNNTFQWIGGSYEGTAKVGNAVEVAYDTSNINVSFNNATQIFDAAYSPQAWASSGPKNMNNSYWGYNTAYKCGDCFEYFSSNYSSGSIVASTKNISVEYMTCVDMGKGFGETEGSTIYGRGIRLSRTIPNTQNFTVRNILIYNSTKYLLTFGESGTKNNVWNSTYWGAPVLDYNYYTENNAYTHLLRFNNTDYPNTNSSFGKYVADSRNDTHSKYYELYNNTYLFNSYANEDWRPNHIEELCTMSTTGSYVGAYPCIDNLPTAPTVTPDETQINTNQNVTCTATGSTDADGDSITYYYYFNDTDGMLQDWSTNPEYSCANSGCDFGDNITCSAKARAFGMYSTETFSETIFVNSTYPSVPSSVNISPTHPNSDSILSCVASGSIGSGIETLSYYYRYKDNNSVYFSDWNSDSTFYCYDAICPPAGYIYCEAIATVGDSNSSIKVSDHVRINSAPSIPTMVSVNQTVLTWQTIECNANGSIDLDNDTITYIYQFNKSGTILQAWSTNNTFDCNTDGCNAYDVIGCNARATTDYDVSSIRYNSTLVYDYYTTSYTSPTLLTEYYSGNQSGQIYIMDDTFVAEDLPNDNWGQDGTITTSSSQTGTPDANREFYMEFDLTQDHFGDIFPLENVTLNLYKYITVGSSATTYFGISYCNDTFNENTITYNNKSTEVTSCKIFYNATYTSDLTNGWKKYDLTSIVNENQRTSFSLRFWLSPLSNSVDQELRFNSTESGLNTMPWLNITSNSTNNFTIWAYDKATGNPIQNFSVNITQGIYKYNWITTNGVIVTNLDSRLGTEYNITIQDDTHLSSSYSDYNISNNPLNTTLYYGNSVNIYLYYENNFSRILETVYLNLYNSAYSNNYSTSSSELTIFNIDEGNYVISAYNNNLPIRLYNVTISNTSSQNLNIYLLPSTNQALFTTKNSEDGTIIEGATISINRLINSDLITVSVLTTDVTGRAVFYYDPNTKYIFSISKTDYETKEFEINPLVYDPSCGYACYEIRLTKLTDNIISNRSYSMIFVGYSPDKYYTNSNQLMNLFIYDSLGTLQSYNYTVTYSGIRKTGSGNNAYGEAFNIEINTSYTSIFDKVIIDVYTTNVYGETKNYHYENNIKLTSDIGINYTFSDNQNQTYGLGIFERILIVTFAVILFGGAIFYWAGELPGAVISFLILGWFVKTGFIEIWLVLIPCTIGLLIIAKRSL